MTLKKNSIKKKKNFSINFGPQHPAAHGVLRLTFVLKREIILRAECLMGILHRGTERFIEYKIYLQALPYFNRQYYVSMMAQGYFYCLAISLLTGSMTLWLLVWDQPQSHIGLLKFMSKMQIFLEVPSFWQIGFQDPASILMEGVLLVFNKHILFILCVLVPSGIWLLIIAFYYFVELQDRKFFKFIHLKDLEILCACAVFFLIVLPVILQVDLTEIPVTNLDQEPLSTEQEVHFEVNPKMYGSETVDEVLVREIYCLISEFRRRGYSEKRLHLAFWLATENFWSLEYSEKVISLQEYFDHHEDKKILKAELLENRSFLFLYVLFIFLFLIVPRGARGGR
jgi:Cytochrome C oxidase subunit II, transmembrane domain